MTIYRGSRYENVPVYRHFDTDNAPQKVMLERRNLTNFPVKEGMTHVFKEGDRIDLIATTYYSDPQMWWLIMDANPRYMTPWDIKVGDVLAIPPYMAEAIR
jgi:nucleoid-associated protein YgaU